MKPNRFPIGLQCPVFPLNIQSSTFNLQFRIARIRYSFRGFPALYDSHITRFNIINGFDITESDTLRIAVTDVALENPPVGRIKIHCTERAHANACSAANTGIIVNAYAIQLHIL
jgi:hypothetical protein